MNHLRTGGCGLKTPNSPGLHPGPAAQRDQREVQEKEGPGLGGHAAGCLFLLPPLHLCQECPRALRVGGRKLQSLEAALTLQSIVILPPISGGRMDPAAGQVLPLAAVIYTCRLLIRNEPPLSLLPNHGDPRAKTSHPRKSQDYFTFLPPSLREVRLPLQASRKAGPPIPAGPSASTPELGAHNLQSWPGQGTPDPSPSWSLRRVESRHPGPSPTVFPLCHRTPAPNFWGTLHFLQILRELDFPTGSGLCPRPQALSAVAI